VTQHVLPTGPFFDAPRNNAFDVTVDFNCQGLVNPLMDVGKFLPHSVYTKNYGNYEDQKDIDPYQALTARDGSHQAAHPNAGIRDVCAGYAGTYVT
jgi:hypothetical protein